MATIAPGRLLSVEGVGDPVSVLQTNLEALTEDVYEFTPTYQSGVETALIGPPTSATFTVDTLWKDAWLAQWRCTVAGTPGTWRQETPAIRAGEPSSGTIPTGYQILDSSANYRRKYHAGGYTWTPVCEAYGATATVFNSVFDTLGAMGSAGGIYWRSGDDITATAALTGILRGNGLSGPEVIGSLTANRLARIGTSGQTLVNSIVRDDGTNVCVGADVVAGQLVFQVTGGISLIGASSLQTSSGALTLDTTDSSGINFKIGGSNGWRITSASILESVGAATVRTSSGILTIATGAGNGNVNINAHGTGDLAVFTNVLYVDQSAASVGIGTTSPALSQDAGDVTLTVLSATSNRAGNLELAGTSLSVGLGNGSNITFYNVSAGNNKLAQIEGYRTSAVNDGGLAFRVGSNAGGGLATAMTIIETGYVGIGTTAPSTLLHVGLAGTTLGTIGLAGNTSGLVTLTVAAAAGTWTMKLPTAVGTAGYQLTDAAGDGITSWAAAASTREAKDIIGLFDDADDALAKLNAATVYRFRYKAGLGTGDCDTEYAGIMADENPWAMHFRGSVLNPVSTFGYTVLAVQALHKKIETLELLVSQLKARKGI